MPIMVLCPCVELENQKTLPLNETPCISFVSGWLGFGLGGGFSAFTFPAFLFPALVAAARSYGM